LKVFEFLECNQVIVLSLYSLFKNKHEIWKVKFFWHYGYNENHKVVAVANIE